MPPAVFLGLSRSVRQVSTVRRRCSLARSIRVRAAHDGQHSLSRGKQALTDISAAFPALPTKPPTAADSRPAAKVELSGATDAATREMDWDGWSAFFDEMDECATRYSDLEALLTQAVQQEDYEHAAELKQELKAIEAKDSVAGILKELQQALADEDYSRAADLRDSGGACLLGWWQGKAGDDDPCGHLLRIEDDFGRYVGTMYKASDMAELKGYTEDSFFLSPSPPKPRSLRDVGTPMMEMFVQRRQDGSFAQQVCALLPEQQAGRDAIELQVELSTDEDDLAAHSQGVSVNPLTPGSSTMTMQLGFPFSNLQADEQADSSTDETDRASDDDDSPVSRNQNRGAEGVEGPSGRADLTAAPGSSIGDTLDDNVMSSGVLFPFASQFLSGEVSTSASFDGGDGGELLMHRAQAVIRMSGRDAFEFEVLRVPEEDSDDDMPAEPSVSGRAEALLRQVKEDRESVGSAGDATSAALHRRVVEAARDLAVKKRRDTEAPEGTRQEMEKELRRMTRELLRHSYGVSEGVRIGQVSVRQSYAEKASYRRLQPSTVRTDPLSGLFLGAFGMHGPELLQLSRGTNENGDEMVYGVKVTGDENVPAGSLSFRAKVGRRHRLDPHEYPPELGVVARYKGNGRIAMQGFTNPKWVDGELLHFSRHSSTTRGAELGFVWNMPGGSKYLILLNRMELE